MQNQLANKRSREEEKEQAYGLRTKAKKTNAEAAGSVSSDGENTQSKELLHETLNALKRLEEVGCKPNDASLLREISFKIDQLHYAANLPKQSRVNPPVGEELLARTWPELMRHLDLNSWDNHKMSYSTPFLFRGLPNRDFRMITSLQRLGYPIGSAMESKVERGILRSFLNYCHGSLDTRASIFEWLTLAQHHGCPTRIMDFTYSPLIALHFATRDPSRDDADAVVWCVDPRKCRNACPSYKNAHDAWSKASGDSFWSICRPNQMLSMIDHAKFCSEAQSKLDQEEATAPVRRESQLHKLRTLDNLGVIGDALVFMEGPAVHERVRNQNHVFAFLSGKTRSIDEWLESRKDFQTYRKVIIDKSLKAEIRERLYTMGITERLLFPGLSGTSKWLKNKYTPSIDRVRANAFMRDMGVEFDEDFEDEIDSPISDLGKHALASPKPGSS